MQPSPIDRTLITDLEEALSRNRRVRRSLEPWGRIYIDHRQPALCVYRKPANMRDSGTETLLLGQASFLLLPADKSCHRANRDLVEAILGQFSAPFGGVLLLELWADQATPVGSDEAPASPPRFHIMAPRHGSPDATLETLEKAILAEHWPHGRPHLAVNYTDRCAPPGLDPLITRPGARRLNCVPLGLRIAPIYRDPKTSNTFPPVLRSFRRSLGHVLKQGIFTFAHTESHYRPGHYHELGAHAVSREVWTSDRKLAAIADMFDLVLHLTPVNAGGAWRAFRRGRYQRTPEFHYRPQTVDAASLKALLYRLPIENIDDPALYGLFAEKRDELDRQITMLSDRGTARVLPGSLQVYERPDKSLLDLARRLLRAVPAHTADDRRADSIDSEAFAQCARKEIAKMRSVHPRLEAKVQIRDDIPGIMVSAGDLLIGRQVRMPRARIDATIQHEVGTHILTYYNGLAQPLRQLHSGTAGYEELQEGLAVLSEFLVGGLSRPRLRVLAGRVLAVESVIEGGDFIDTFRLLHEKYDFSASGAFSITMRVHRGGGFTKDAIYLRGFVSVLDRIGKGLRLEDLLLGKISLAHAPIMKELTWRKVLKPAPLRPSYLDDPRAKSRLAAAVKGLCVMDIAEDLGS
ncbi:MAG: DUF1704 domain-containing protein [Alphaproteobacteria bacterium]|nr:DUF1704 domain-containing protein [Alphaproteobacteria bacterium]